MKEISRAYPLFLTLILLSLIPLSAVAYECQVLPSLNVERAAGEIHIDGHLEDTGWRGAAHAENFCEIFPGDRIEPRAATEAWITYDDDNLYVAFLCHDDPELIRATLCQRDQFFNDDEVGLLLDTFGEAQWAYEFFANPYGIQKDLMYTNVQGEDRGFDMIWHSAGRITEHGYVVEMAIPFAGLRFPAGREQSWRINFWRNQPRQSDHQDSWAALDRNDQCRPCQWGTLEGLEGVKAGKGLEFLPSFIGYQTGEIRDVLDADSGIENEDLHGEVSLGAKYSVTSDVTLEGTINPDFSQIEADAAQIDINSTILQRFAERRPFFQEGNDLFRTYFNSFYTRMVVDPVVAAKGTARWEKTSVAALYARDENSPYIVPTEERSYLENLGDSDVGVLRVLHSLGNNNQVGVMATQRNYDTGGNGTIVSLDSGLRLTPTLTWIGQYVLSHTEEPEGYAVNGGETFADGEHTVALDGESYSGNAFISELRRNGRNWNFVLDYNEVDQTYRTQTGYDPWNDQRNAFAWSSYNIDFNSGLIERIVPGIFTNARWNMDGARKWLRSSASVDIRLRRAQTIISLGYTRGEETWGGVDFSDLWNANIAVQSRPSSRLGWAASVSRGEGPALFTLERGDELAASFALDIKPVDNLTLEPNLDYIRSEENATGDLLYEQIIARARLRWQLSPRLSLRLVVQHNSSENPPYREAANAGNFPTYHMNFGSKWEVDPLVTYRINSFSMMYVGSTHDFRDFNAAPHDAGSLYRQTARQYFMKLQYLFQI